MGYGESRWPSPVTIPASLPFLEIDFVDTLCHKTQIHVFPLPFLFMYVNWVSLNSNNPAICMSGMSETAAFMMFTLLLLWHPARISLNPILSIPVRWMSVYVVSLFVIF